MSANVDLATSVSEELFWNPVVDDASIAVSADDGKITLRGTVGSLREKREAEQGAQRVFGVVSVESRLQVKPMEGDQRTDAELRGDVLQALMLDGLVPDTVDAQVEDGHVTLTGRAQWQYQRDEAERVASNVAGVLNLVDEIELDHPRASAGDVRESIEKAFKRNASLDADDLQISAEDGTVTLTGTVGSWAEHDEAIAAAWTAAGVTSVRDHITVEYGQRSGNASGLGQ
jgi:osmotically-inducible protein OsmY